MEDYEHESERRGLPLQTVLGDEGDRRRAILSIASRPSSDWCCWRWPSSWATDGPWWFFGLLGVVALATVVIAAWNVRVWVVWGNPAAVPAVVDGPPASAIGSRCGSAGGPVGP